jgi:hypothetical protein
MAQRHINDKEAQAFLNVLLAFEPSLVGVVVQPQGDSRTANAAIREFRGSVRSAFRNQAAKRAWAFAQRVGCSILPIEYINTLDNTHADEDSRWTDYQDWVVTDAAWGVMEEAFGPHTFDRFASLANTRCGEFTSRYCQPGCHWPDSLHQPWGLGHNNYCCPPETLLLPLLNHLERCKAVATVVVPNYPGRWAPVMARLEVARVPLPPVAESFAPGPSGSVEPWRQLGVGQNRSYVAVRVDATGTKAARQPFSTPFM